MGYVDTLPTSFYATLGGLVASNPNGNFARFLFNQTTSYPKGTSTASFIYAGSLATVQFGGGVEFASHKRFWMRHRAEMQYFHLKGNFGYDFQEGQTSYFYNMQDHTEGEFVMDALTISYKFEPSARRFYGSLGINAVISNVVLIENIERNTTDFSGRTVDEVFTKRAGCHPVNYPFSIGGGMIFRTSKLIIKPGAYFMPCFNNSFYYYTIAVSIGWRTYQLMSD